MKNRFIPFSTVQKFLFITISAFLSVNFAAAQFQTFEKFIPNGFSILDSASGDINLDGIDDIVLILRRNYEQDNSDTIRPLLLLEGNKTGQFTLISRNDSVVMCMECGGVFGDPYNSIIIKKGYFSIEHFGGSNLRWTRSIAFKFNLKTKQFVLRRDVSFSWHVSDPNKQTKNTTNKQDFNHLQFSQFSYLKNW